MYVVFVANPYNGNAIILHSKAVHEAALDTYGFIELESSACLYAVALPYSQVPPTRIKALPLFRRHCCN